MLYAVLVCSDDRCEIAYEAWGEADQLETLSCEECDADLRIVAFSQAERDGVVPRTAELHQRRAA
jgi:hypothetical protein